MKLSKRYCISGERVLLRPLVEADVTERYVTWLNDPQVNRFLEVRFTRHELNDVRNFVRSVVLDPCAAAFAIVDKNSDLHIGNIKVGLINWRHGFGEVSLFIGEKGFWGRGYATEAISLVTQQSFAALGLRRLEAEVYASNIASIAAFRKAGWIQEACLKEKWTDGDVLVAGIRLGCVRQGAPVRRSPLRNARSRTTR